MSPADYVVSCLATRMFSEPKDEGLLGFTACGLVIRNRVMAGWGPWLTLIMNHDKHSAKPDEPRALVFGDPDHDTIFRRCIGIAGEHLCRTRARHYRGCFMVRTLG